MDSNLVKDLFQITYRCSYECPESGETLETEETSDTLYCNIRGGPNDEEKVNFMFQVGVSFPVFRRESSWVSRARWRNTPKRSVAARRGKNTGKSADCRSISVWRWAFHCLRDSVHAVLLEGVTGFARRRSGMQDHASGGVSVPFRRARTLYGGVTAVVEREDDGWLRIRACVRCWRERSMRSV